MRDWIQNIEKTNKDKYRITYNDFYEIERHRRRWQVYKNMIMLEECEYTKKQEALEKIEEDYEFEVCLREM